GPSSARSNTWRPLTAVTASKTTKSYGPILNNDLAHRRWLKQDSRLHGIGAAQAIAERMIISTGRVNARRDSHAALGTGQTTSIGLGRLRRHHLSDYQSRLQRLDSSDRAGDEKLFSRALRCGAPTFSRVRPGSRPLPSYSTRISPLRSPTTGF